MTNQEIIDAAERHAAGLHAQLAKPDWRPSRAHVEQARNSIAKLVDALRAAARPAQAQEPVAWLYETWIGGDAWSQKYSDTKIEHDSYIRNIRPLYLAARPALPTREEVAQTLCHPTKRESIDAILALFTLTGEKD